MMNMVNAERGEVVSGGVLSRERIRSMIVDGSRPLFEGFRDLEMQLQPNGFDMTLREITRYAGRGKIGVSNEDRTLPDLLPLTFDGDGWIDLEPGIYQIVYNEVVTLPETLMALGRPRSSLGRCGVTIHTAVWDAGYSGRSTSLLSVLNPAGFRVQQHARVMQLVFASLGEATAEGYRGQYQDENVG